MFDQESQNNSCQIHLRLAFKVKRLVGCQMLPTKADIDLYNSIEEEGFLDTFFWMGRNSTLLTEFYVNEN